MLDTEFDHEHANVKQVYFNEIYTPIFEKNVLSPIKRSVFQLLDAIRLNEKGPINSYKTTAKTHATVDKNFAIPLYANICIFRCQDAGRKFQM